MKQAIGKSHAKKNLNYRQIDAHSEKIEKFGEGVSVSIIVSVCGVSKYKSCRSEKKTSFTVHRPHINHSFEKYWDVRLIPNYEWADRGKLVWGITAVINTLCRYSGTHSGSILYELTMLVYSCHDWKRLVKIEMEIEIQRNDSSSLIVRLQYKIDLFCRQSKFNLFSIRIYKYEFFL